MYASSLSGEEEVPPGVVGVITNDAPDVLAHISVRARNLKVLDIYVHKYLHIYVYICIYMYIYIHICIFMHVCMYVCILLIYVFICICMYLYVYACMYVCNTYVCILLI